MPDQSAEYWEEKAQRALVAARKATNVSLRLAFLEIAQNYKQLAAHTQKLEQWQQKK